MAPPVPTIRPGALATSGAGALNPDQLVIDMLGEVFEYDPSSSPLLTVVTKPMRGQVKAATNTTIKHLEDQPLPEWDTITQSRIAGDLTVTVTNINYYRVGDILKHVTSGETVRVTAINTGSSTLTITRSWGATAAASWANGDYLLNLSAAEAEGDLSPEAKSTVTVTRTNFCQIVKTPVHITKTAQNVKNYGGNERLRQRRKAGAKHARIWEQIILHGEKNEDTSGATAIRTTGGIDEHITSNVLAAGGVLTEPEFLDLVGDTNRYSVSGGMKRKGLLVSRELGATMDMWGNNKLVTNVSAEATYGFSVSTYVSRFGTLDVITHPLLEYGYAGYGYIVDWDGVIFRPYRETQLETNIQQNGEDAWKDQYITEAGASFALESAFAKISGVTF